MKPLVDHVNGTLVECNAAYPGQRDTSEKHWKVIEKHGLNKITKFDLMDEDGEIELPVPEGLQIKKIMWVRTYPTMIHFWSCRTLKDINEGDSAVR